MNLKEVIYMSQMDASSYIYINIILYLSLELFNYLCDVTFTLIPIIIYIIRFMNYKL